MPWRQHRIGRQEGAQPSRFSSPLRCTHYTSSLILSSHPGGVPAPSPQEKHCSWRPDGAWARWGFMAPFLLRNATTKSHLALFSTACQHTTFGQSHKTSSTKVYYLYITNYVKCQCLSSKLWSYAPVEHGISIDSINNILYNVVTNEWVTSWWYITRAAEVAPD